MKRIILLAALLAAASACSSNTNTNTSTANTNTSAGTGNTTTASPMPEPGVSDAEITAREKEIWDKIKQKDSAGFGSMLADDFLYVSGTGVLDKAGTVADIKNFAPTEINFSDWKVVAIDKDAALVVYTVSMKGTASGQPLPEAPLRCGSIWAKRNGKWMGVFHQETTVEKPPAESAAPKTAEKPAATAKNDSMAVPVIPDDPVEREKQVWDSIKKKDYDRFASFLAEDQVEVFSWGVNDKAKSIEGVKQVDLSGAVLSDFKTLKIDDDATVVTYMVKGPTPPFEKGGERSSSAWVKRGGKWLAVYHQGTAVGGPAPMTSKK